ncbi:MAG TPA: FAD-dependent oxidoreductase [Drouetiella sp.]
MDETTTKPISAQVLIIGSGAGGATTAAILAQAGYDVLVLEEGQRVPFGMYGQSPTKAMSLLYRNKGMTPILGSVPIGYVEGRCMGGSTEINSGLWQRLSPEFALRWRVRFGLADALPEQLEPHFDWAESMLHVANSKTEWPASTKLMHAGAQQMGWSIQEIPRAAKDCQNTNACSVGCPTGAKQGMTRNIIPLAQQHGARFLPSARVKFLMMKKRRVTGVIAEVAREDRIDLVRIDAEHVFVCAGASQTPALLRRSGIKRNVGDTFQIHPMLKVSALFNEKVDADKSVLPFVQVKEFWPDITIGGSFFSVGHLAMGLSDNWIKNSRVMSEAENMATYYVSVRGTGPGSVRTGLFGEMDAVVKYELTKTDLHNLSQGFARLGQLLFASGAKKIYPSVQGMDSLSDRLQAIRWLDEDLAKSRLSLTTVHAFASCPMGDNEDRCAADSFGKVYGTDNLYLNDASMLPDSPGTNPQGTIMALARRNALHFISNEQSRDATTRNFPELPTSIKIESATNHTTFERTEKAMNTAIITGVPGWLGNRFVKAISEGLPDVEEFAQPSQREVRVLYFGNEGGSKKFADNVRSVNGDIRDPAALKTLFAGAEGSTVFHIAGIVHPSKPDEFTSINFEGTKNMLDAAIAAGAKRFVYVSSNSPIGLNPTNDNLFDENSPYNPYMGYGKSKMNAELAVKAAQGKIETVIIRPPWFYGPEQPARQLLFFTMIKNGKAPIVGSGNNKRSMAYVDNICQGLLLAEARECAANQIYWIADRDPYTMNQIVDTIEELLESEFGMKVAHKRMRLPDIASEVALTMDATMQSIGAYHQKIHVLSEMNKTIACSVKKAESELGYDPKVSLKDGMRRSIQSALYAGHKI